MTKNKNKTKTKSKQTTVIEAAKKPAIKPRNAAALSPLLRKGHVHEKPTKTVRSKDKQALRKQLSESAKDD